MFKSLSRAKSVKNLRPRGGGDKEGDDRGVSPAMHGPELESPGLEQGPVSEAPQTPTSQPPMSHITGSSPTASHFSQSPSDNDGSNAYMTRPLPQPPAKPSSRPSSKASSRHTTAERPRTSAGPGTGTSSPSMLAEAGGRRPSAPAAGKRMSRDDLYLDTRPPRSFRSYHIPIRGTPPSPHGSLRTASPAPTVTVRTQTPDSIAGTNRAAPIGMALGSPGFPPPAQAQKGGSWQPQLRGIENRPPWEEEEPPVGPAPARKPSKWRLFGLLGRKNTSKERLVQTPDVVPAPAPASAARPRTASGIVKQEDVGRSNTTAGKKSRKAAPTVVRSQTEPAVEPSAPGTPKEGKTPKPQKVQKAQPVQRSGSTRSVKKSDISAPMPMSTPMPVRAPPPIPSMPPPSKSLMDVEIPDVKMERYSVMFDGILQSGGQGSPSNNRYSVHAKRQTTMQKLESIQDASMEEEARAKAEAALSEGGPLPSAPDAEYAAKGAIASTNDCDTRTVTVTVPARPSYSHAKSPSFSLFPPTPSSTSHKGKSTPASRSATSSAALSSPTKTSFDIVEPPGMGSFVLPPPIRSGRPNSRAGSQISQQSQDIPILLDGDERGRDTSVGSTASQKPADEVRAGQSGYGSRSRSSSRSTQRSKQTLQGRVASGTQQSPASRIDRAAKPAPLHISRAPQGPEQGHFPPRSDSRAKVPHPIQTSQQRSQRAFQPDQSSLQLDSPDSPETASSRTTQRTHPSEPAWQMMSPPTSSISSASTSTSSRKRSPSSVSSTNTQSSGYAGSTSTYTRSISHSAKPSTDDTDVGGPVEVSIARQISVSRQQRNLLQQGGRARPWRGPDGTPGSADRLRKIGGDGERLGGTRMARPRLVPAAEPENRKSERIVVEGA